ncbi:MAG: hypothetical protein WC340_17545 [Kiritimatiellia bacterium]
MTREELERFIFDAAHSRVVCTHNMEKGDWWLGLSAEDKIRACKGELLFDQAAYKEKLRAQGRCLDPCVPLLKDWEEMTKGLRVQLTPLETHT